MFESAGAEVRGLESGGDHAVYLPSGLVLASECKRAERLKVPEWWRQTRDDAPAGTIPVLTFRQNRQEPLSVLRTVDLLALLAKVAP